MVGCVTRLSRRQAEKERGRQRGRLLAVCVAAAAAAAAAVGNVDCVVGSVAAVEPRVRRAVVKRRRPSLYDIAREDRQQAVRRLTPPSI